MTGLTRMAHTHENTIQVECTPERLYGYVTQPWRWHEWHPNSRSATEPDQRLAIGDTFEEVIEIAPFSPLPPTLRRKTSYRVIKAEQAREWEVRGETGDGWLQIRYRFEPCEHGTRFTRTLTFETHGLSALLMPFLRSRMGRMSVIALQNLKHKAEALQEREST